MNMKELQQFIHSITPKELGRVYVRTVVMQVHSLLTSLTGNNDVSY